MKSQEDQYRHHKEIKHTIEPEDDSELPPIYDDQELNVGAEAQEDIFDRDV